MRSLILLCLVILIICIFYFPLNEGFVDGSGNPVPLSELAKSMGSMLQAIYPNFKIRPVEPDFTETNPSKIADLLKDDLRKEVEATPILLQGNEMLRQDR